MKNKLAPRTGLSSARSCILVFGISDLFLKGLNLNLRFPKETRFLVSHVRLNFVIFRLSESSQSSHRNSRRAHYHSATSAYQSLCICVFKYYIKVRRSTPSLQFQLMFKPILLCFLKRPRVFNQHIWNIL